MSCPALKSVRFASPAASSWTPGGVAARTRHRRLPELGSTRRRRSRARPAPSRPQPPQCCHPTSRQESAPDSMDCGSCPRSPCPSCEPTEQAQEAPSCRRSPHRRSAAGEQCQSPLEPAGSASAPDAWSISARWPKHFTLTIADGSFAVERNQTQIEEEALLDGIYVIRTDQPATRLAPAAGMRAYKQLKVNERSFKEMKSTLEIRPIHHRLADRVRAHVFLCMLARYVQFELADGSLPCCSKTTPRSRRLTRPRPPDARRPPTPKPPAPAPQTGSPRTPSKTTRPSSKHAPSN